MFQVATGPPALPPNQQCRSGHVKNAAWPDTMKKTWVVLVSYSSSTNGVPYDRFIECEHGLKENGLKKTPARAVTRLGVSERKCRSTEGAIVGPTASHGCMVESRSLLEPPQPVTQSSDFPGGFRHMKKMSMFFFHFFFQYVKFRRPLHRGGGGFRHIFFFVCFCIFVSSVFFCSHTVNVQLLDRRPESQGCRRSTPPSVLAVFFFQIVTDVTLLLCTGRHNKDIAVRPPAGIAPMLTPWVTPTCPSTTSVHRRLRERV